MQIKTKRSRSFSSFEHVKGISIEKMKKQMERLQKSYEKLRSQSEGKLQIALRHPRKLQSLNIKKKQDQQYLIHDLNKRQKLSLGKNTKTLRLNSESMIIKLENQTSLKQIIPNQGYAYLDISHLNCGLNPQKKFQIVIQKGGVILQPFERNEQNQFYKIEKFERILKICNKIKEIQFFGNLKKTKYFVLWKFFIKQNRIQKIKDSINPLLQSIYSERLLDMRKYILQIKTKKFIQPPQNSPIGLEQYRSYLQTGCSSALSKLESNFLTTIVKKSIQTLEDQIILNKEKINLMYRDFTSKNFENKIRIKTMKSMSTEQIKRKSQFNLNYDYIIKNFTIFFRKVMYFLTEFTTSLFKNVLNQVQQLLNKTHEDYLQRKPLYIHYLSKVQKIFFEPQGLNNQEKKVVKTISHQIFMFEVNQIQLIKIQFSLNKNLVNSIYQSSNELIKIFKEFIDFIKKIFEKQNVLDFEGVEETQRQIFREVSQKIDEYKFGNFLKDLEEYKNLDSWLPKIILKAASQTEDIFNHINPIVEQINQFIKQGQQMMPKNQNLVPAAPKKKAFQRRNAITVDMTPQKQHVKRFEEEKSSLLNFFERKSSLMSKLQKLPNFINISIYCVSLQRVKKQFEKRIQVIENQIKIYVPQSFDKIADQMFFRLAQIDKKILIYNWSIEEFVISAKGQTEYNELNNSGSIFKCTEALNKFLTILAQVSDTLFKQKSLKILKVKSQIKRLAQKVEEFESRKIQKLKDFRNGISTIKQQIWHELVRIQNQIHEKLNKEHQNIMDIVDYFPEIEEHLEKTKNKIQNVTFIENMRFQNSLSAQKPTQFASYIKLKNDTNLLKQFVQKYIQIKQKIEAVFEEPLKSKIILQILQDINEAINDCRLVQQSLVPYLILINEIKAEYYEYQSFFETANEMSYLQPDQLEQIQNKKYFDFSKKKKYCIRDIYNYKLHQKHSELSLVFLRKYYKRVLSDLIVQLEDFIERKSLAMETEVIKYIKDEDGNKSKDYSDNSFSNSSAKSSSHSDSDEIIQNKSFDLSRLDKSISICKKAKKNTIEATSTQKILVFLSIAQYKCVLIDLEMELNQLRNTCQSISQGSFKQESNQISNQIKILVSLFGQLQQSQQSYIQLLKHGCLKGSPFFEDIASCLQEAKSIWNSQITGIYGQKSISYVVKNYKQFKKTLNTFKKLLSRINGTIETKIQDRRKQLSLLYLCSNSTVLKIIQNPLHFVHEFYSSVDQICLDPESKCLFIETFYKEELKIIFKNKNSMQLNKIRQQIAKHIKLQCYFNLKDTYIAWNKNKKRACISNGKNQPMSSEHSENKSTKPQRKVIANVKKSGKQLIQVSYLCYYIEMQYALENKEEAQIVKTINKQIEYLKTEYENLHSYYQNMLLKIDTLISLCLQFRGRVRNGQADLLGNCLAYSIQLKQENVIKSKLLKQTFKNMVNQKKLSKRKSSKEEINKFQDIVSQAKEASSNFRSTFVINQQKKQSKKTSFLNKKSSMISPTSSKLKINGTQQNSQQNMQINTQKKRLQFNSFKVKLCNYFQTIELSYDLIDPKCLVHYVSSQKMLLNLFNSFYDPMLKPTIVQDQEPINSLSCRLFRLYRKISYHSQNSEMSSNLLLNCVKLGKMTIAFCLEEQNEESVKNLCSFLSYNIKKYVNQFSNLAQTIMVKTPPRKRDLQLEKMVIEQRIPNLFVVNNKKLYDQSIKTKKEEYRVVSLQTPFMEQILQMFTVSLASRYSVKIMKIIVDYLKVYQFFFLQTKGEKMNIENSKEMLLHILQQIEIILSKEYRQCFRNCLQDAVNRKIQMILSLPLYSLGLKEEEVNLVLQKFLNKMLICVQTQEIHRGSKTSEQSLLNEEQKKISCNKTKILHLQKQLSFMLSPIFQSKFGDNGKVIALIGDEGIGKSYCIRECVNGLPDKYQTHQINVKLYDQYTQFLVSVQTIQQLCCKLTQKYENELKNTRKSMSEKYFKVESKMLMVYNGFEGIKSRRVIELCELLIDPESQQMNENKTKSIVEMKNLNHICPKLLSNLSIISFDNLQLNPESYLLKIQESVVSLWLPQNSQHIKITISEDRISERLSQSGNNSNGNKNIIQKHTLKHILRLIPHIYDKIININEDGIWKKATKAPHASMKLCVSQRQFYLMLTSLFTSHIHKYEKKWRNLANSKEISTINSIKKIIAFSLYWNFYYTLQDHQSRPFLYEKLIQIKQFQQLYNPNAETTLLGTANLNSLFNCNPQFSITQSLGLGSKMLIQESLQNKSVEFTDDGIIFVKNTISNSTGFEIIPSLNSLANFHDFLYIETPEIKNLSRICKILLHSNKLSKGIYIIGEKCSGKSKFIKNFFRTLRQDYQLADQFDKKFNRILQIQIKDHHNHAPQPIKKQKISVQQKNRNQENQEELLSNLNQKMKTSSSSASIRELSRRLFRFLNSKFINRSSFHSLKLCNSDSQISNTLIYVDDCSLNPDQSLKGSIVHQFLKNLCEQSYFLFNQEINVLNNLQIFYESRTSSKKEQTAHLVAEKWFMFPIYYSFNEDYLPKIFENLIQRSLVLGVMPQQTVYSLSSKTLTPQNLMGDSKSFKNQQQTLIQSLISTIKYLKEKNSFFESTNGQILSKNRNNQSSMLKKPASWLYEFTWKNIYNTLYQFLTLLKSNENNGKTIKNSTEKINIKYGDISSIISATYHENERSMNSNFEVMQTMIIFNMTSRLKPEHQDFTSLVSLREKKHKKIAGGNYKRQKEQIYRKYRESSIFFNTENQIDLLAQKLSEKRTLRKPILYSQFRENLYKFEFAIKTSRFIMVNRTEMFDGNNFIDIASELLNVKIHKVEGVAYDFDGTLSRLSKIQKTRHICVYIPLQTIYNYPEILNSVEEQIKIVYNLKDRPSANYTFSPGSRQGSIKNLMPDFGSPPYCSALKLIDKDIQMKDYQFTYVIEYPSAFDVASLPFIENKLVLNYSCTLWLEPITASSKYQGAQPEKKSELKMDKVDQNLCLQMLRQTGKNKNSITTQYLSQVYPKKNRQKIEEFAKIMQKLLQNLEKEFKSVLPSSIYGYLFSYPNYLQACKNFIDIYSRCEIQTKNKIKSIESALSSLQFLFRQYEDMRGQYLNLVRNCKELEQEISIINEKVESKRKVIEQYISSGDKEQQKRMHKRCLQNEEEIISIGKKTEEYRVLAMKNYEQINRTQIAQIKYLLSSSFQTYQHLFELIAVVLADQTIPLNNTTNNNVNPYKEFLRKCITDVNMMAKMKQQGLLEGKSEDVIKLLVEKLGKIEQKESQKENASFMKNIYGWIKYSVKLVIFTNAKKIATTKLSSQIEELKEKIVQIYEKYKVQNSLSLINSLQKQLVEKQSKLKILISQSERESIKLTKCSELVQKFREFEKHCLFKLQDLNLRVKNYMSDSLVATLECCFSFSMPFEFRNEFRGKYEKIIERILVQRDRLQKRVQTDLMEVDLKNLNTIEQNKKYCITNHTPFFLTNQRKKFINSILLNFCHQNTNHRKLTIIDPHSMFIREFSIVTELSYICLNLDQLNHPNISKFIENINVIFIKTPPNQWTLQFIKPEIEDDYILDMNNYRLKWNKVQVKLSKMQRCIILKESVENLNDLAEQNHNIVYYDLQNEDENEKIVDKILRSFHYRDYCSLVEKKMPQLRSYFEIYPEKSQVIKQFHAELAQKQNISMYSLIQQICRNSSNFGLNRVSYVSELCTKIDSFIEEVQKCKQLSEIIEIVNNCIYFQAGTNKYLDDFSKEKMPEERKQFPEQNFNHRANTGVTGQQNLAIKQNKPFPTNTINTIKQISKLISISFEIVRNLMVKFETPTFSQNTTINDLLQNENKQLFYTVSFVQKIQRKLSPSTNKNQILNKTNSFDISLLKSGIEAAFSYAIEQTNLQSYKKYSERQHRRFSGLNMQQNVLVVNMLKFLFNFLLIGVNDKYEFYYLLELKSKQIHSDRKSISELPEEFFKLISLSKYLVDQEVKYHQASNNPPQSSEEANLNQVENDKSEKQINQDVIGSKIQVEPGQTQEISKNERQRRIASLKKSRKSIGNSETVPINTNKSKLKNQIAQIGKNNEINRMLIYWQYSRIKHKYNSANFINSGYEKAYQNIYKLIKKSIAQGKKSKNQLIIDIRKLIDEQKQISESERMELFSYFDKNQFRQQLLNKSFTNMLKYELAKQQTNLAHSSRKQRIDQKNREDYCVSNRLVQTNSIISSYIFPNCSVNKVEKGSQKYQSYKSFKEKKVKKRNHNILCSYEDKNELNFVLEIMRFKNEEIEANIKANSSAGVDMIKIDEKVRSNSQGEMKGSTNRRQKNIEGYKSMKVNPYYIIYQPCPSQNLSIKQLEQLYDSVDWPQKVFVVVFSEEHWLKETSIENDEKNLIKFLYGNKSMGEYDGKKNCNNLESNYSNQSFKKPLQQIQYLLKREDEDKGVIILSKTNQYYGNYLYKSNKNKTSTIPHESQIHLRNYQKNIQKLQHILFNNSKYHINAVQLILLIAQCQNINTCKLSKIIDPSKAHSNQGNSKIEVTSLSYNTVQDKIKEKLPSKELKLIKKYRLMIERSMKMMCAMERMKCLWDFDRFVESVVAVEDEAMTQVVDLVQQKTSYICRCIQAIFLPKLSIKNRNYVSIKGIVHSLSLPQIEQLVNKPILSHIKLSTFDLDNNSNSNCVKAIEYLSSHIETIRMLSNTTSKVLSAHSSKYIQCSNEYCRRESQDNTRRSMMSKRGENARESRISKKQQDISPACIPAQLQYTLNQSSCFPQPQPPTSSNNIILSNTNIFPNTPTTNNKSSNSFINIIKEYQLQNCNVDILNRIKKILNWIKIYNKDYLLGQDCSNYVRIMKEMGKKRNSIDQFMRFGHLVSMVRELVIRLENCVVWKQYEAKIYVENFRVPAAKYLLKTIIPSQIKLILEPTSHTKLSNSPQHLKRPHQSQQSLPKLKICKTNKIFSNQSLIDRIETNDFEFRIVSQEYNKNLPCAQAEPSKGRSGFYEQQVSIFSNDINRISSLNNNNINNISPTSKKNPSTLKPNNNSQQIEDSSASSQDEQQSERKQKVMILPYPLLSNDIQSDYSSPYNYNYNQICPIMFRVEIDESHVHQLLWKN